MSAERFGFVNHGKKNSRKSSIKGAKKTLNRTPRSFTGLDQKPKTTIPITNEHIKITKINF